MNNVRGFPLGGSSALQSLSYHDRAAFYLYTPRSGYPGGQVAGSVTQAPLHAGVKHTGLPGRGVRYAQMAMPSLGLGTQGRREVH